jgi:NAD(P)-dependent dehydrogenase (short-subunit alcohol dehydrogenase family)
VASYASQTNVFQTVWKKWGRLDVVVANAGIVDRDSKYNFSRKNAPIEDIPPEPDTYTTDCHFKAIMYTTTLARHFMSHNPGKPGGKIVVTGSLAGIYPIPTFPEYSSAKAAVHHWVRTMGAIMRLKDNITVNCVVPGAIKTSIRDDFLVAFRPEQMSKKETLLEAYDMFIEDPDNVHTGKLVEIAHDRMIEWGHPPYKSGAFARRTEKVYEPWFEMIHGERSGLPEALKEPPQQGDKIIAVTGATGNQGGGVVNIMKKVPGWRVRAITRNKNSEAAQKLAAEGIEVVEANYDNEESLIKAFEGVQAIYAVTNWWESLFRGKTPDEASAIEEQQGMNLARAAAATFTLEHYIWSTGPSATRLTNGAVRVHHMDSKARVDERIKSELPDLAAITTYLYVGYYPQNMAFYPSGKPVKFPCSDNWILTIPTKPDAKVLLAGDLSVNPGIWVRQIIASGLKAHGKYANLALEKWTWQQVIDEWSTVTGHKGMVMETSVEAWTKLWGPIAQLLAGQFKLGEICDPWEETDKFITPKELGIDEKEVVGFRGVIEKLKGFFV